MASYKKRFEAGELTRTDVAQSEARLSGATAARIAAEGNLKVSNANYLDVIGLKPESVLTDVKAEKIKLPKTLSEALNLAKENNPQIKAIDFALNSAEKNVLAKKGVLSPVVDVRAGASKNKESNLTRRNDTWQVTANVKVPLYQSGAEYADIRAARHTENQYRILSRKIRSDVEAQTIKAWENYTSTKAQIKSIKSQIKASKIALDGVIREAKVGSRTVLDVLDAEQEHLDNQVTLVKTHRDEVVAAYALLTALGKMNPTDLSLSVSSYDPTAYYKKIENKWIGYDIE
ncbi:MAG: TolC family protein [Alphaproteobacteria bacterium]|nr:TolC family protein [Alphaproteobacteria bacterium]